MKACCSCPPRWADVVYGSRTYRVPRPAACDVEDRRHEMADVADLSVVERADELLAITHALAQLPTGAHPLERAWLLDRRRHLLAADERPEISASAVRYDPEPRNPNAVQPFEGRVARALGLEV
jgi:hypothetical protein